MKLSELSRERLYNEIKLEKGSHQAGNAACLMEMTALLAGEPHTDHPQCACPVITVFAMRLNDVLPDDLRQMLKPYAPAFINTRDGHAPARAEYLALRAVNVFAPFWLRLSGDPELEKHAKRCESARTRAEAKQAILAAAAAAAAAYAATAAVAATTDCQRRHLPAIMPAILDTLDGLLLIGSENRVVRPKGVVAIEPTKTEETA